MDTGDGRGRLSAPLLVAGLVLGLDAIACQLLALVLALMAWLELYPQADGSQALSVARLGVAAVLALWCPAAAALVLAVRTRAARLTGLATAAVLTVGSAALAADGLGNGGGPSGQLIAGLVALLVNVGVVALLTTPGPAPARSAPERLIDLDAGTPR